MFKKKLADLLIKRYQIQKKLFYFVVSRYTTSIRTIFELRVLVVKSVADQICVYLCLYILFWTDNKEDHKNCPTSFHALNNKLKMGHLL